MNLKDIKKDIPAEVYDILTREFKKLRPCQVKAVKKGLFEGKNLLVCTPTASGKTLIAELAIVRSILSGEGKAVYIVPLKALANEKYKDFKKKYSSLFKIVVSVGNMDRAEPYLSKYDLIITTSEKLDSLIRHSTPWLKYVNVVIIDEIHLMNDANRGPTLEVLLTILRSLLSESQFIGLSATIGNPEELSEWLDANVVIDNWRPVKLEKGVYFNNKIEFKK